MQRQVLSLFCRGRQYWQASDVTLGCYQNVHANYLNNLLVLVAPPLPARL